METIRRPAMGGPHQANLRAGGEELALGSGAPDPNRTGVRRLTAAPRHGLLRSWGLLLIAIVLGLSIALLGYDRPTPVGIGDSAAAAEQPSLAAADSAAGASGAPAEPPGTEVTGSPGAVVHVVGQVAQPGVLTLPVGARVADAVAAAGGALPGADLSGVNLARRVNDGEQIAVGVPTVTGPGVVQGSAGPTMSGPASVPGASGGGAADGSVNLNQATSEQLQELPRVGPATAAKIIAYRQENGPFTSVEQLLEVPGIGEGTLAGLRDLVTV